MDAWEGRPTSAWQEQWRVPALHAFAVAGSTNDVARVLAEDGAPHGTVVIADEQYAGRGRHGRRWEAPRGSALLMSVVLRAGRARAPAVAPLRVGLAVAHAIETTCGVDVKLKWPNDVVLNGGKVAGVLCEGSTTGGRMLVIAGIGINVAQQHDDFPADIAGSATSLHLAGCAHTRRADLAGALLDSLRGPAGDIGAPLRPYELAAYRAHDALRGRAVTVDGIPAGIAAGIDATGALRIRRNEDEMLVHTGTIRLAEQETIAQEGAE